MGTYTPNYGLYKPDVGETDWGDKVNANFDTIDSEMNKNRSDIDNVLNNIIPSLRDDIAYNETLISKIKKDVLTIALNVMMHKALLHAETKDFYSIIADVITDEYPNGFKNTFETIPFGVTFDNDGGGTWTQAIKVTLTTVPSEYAQYRIVIQSNTMQIYAADGTLKADYGASTGVASEFWNNVKSDGSDIRIADQNYAQLYFWIEEFDYSGKYAVIWVKVEAGTSELYIIYGNANALLSTYNDGEQVFEFFDGFEGTELNTNKWEYGGKAGTWKLEVSNSILELYGNNGAVWIKSIQSFDYPIIVRAKVMDLSTFDSANKTRNRYISSVINQNPFGSDCGVFDDPDHPAIQLFWQGSYTGIKANTDVWQISEEIFIPNQLFRWKRPEWNKQGSTSLTSIQLQYGVGDYGATSRCGHIKFDFIAVAKLTDPASFGDAEVITLTTTGDFITVTFSFDEGVDKLLITVDTDAQAIYYSTDDGQTWNAIEPDTETLLSETAYSIKWKFEFATYVRGYAFITW